ncbi:hypothetical protein CCH79_00019348 [Gambusia affinis]|uniref:Endonuclease/exonuclease/phosphatase domain-containing protein n=1 Tax=Gambusia affinis TaxID=33528 RepID=A0A315VAM5_GAMAF|nr:hypothetical protein CCH79_00019348 [Gambusia affinis]
MCFTDTWLHPDTPDANVSRATGLPAQQKGGGLAILLNNCWCNPAHITGKERISCPDVELLAVGLCPFYLPREYFHVVVVTVYNPPSASPMMACHTIHSAVARLQTEYPTAFMVVSGDINHVTVDKTLPKFTQYVSCPTREERTLDLLCANMKDSYSSFPLLPLGRSNHKLVHLSPCYIPACNYEDSKKEAKGATTPLHQSSVVAHPVEPNLNKKTDVIDLTLETSSSSDDDDDDDTSTTPPSKRQCIYISKNEEIHAKGTMAQNHPPKSCTPPSFPLNPHHCSHVI